jgi:hypothetical protein
MNMKYYRLDLDSDVIVVVFDICSSSDIIEELTLKGDMVRYQNFLTKLKEYLAEEQNTTIFEPYKFTGDGWILLFPTNTSGKALLSFLKNLCMFFKKEFRKDVLRYLDTPPSITGLTFGLEKGPLTKMTIYGTREYIGRALNIACRLQNSIKDKDSTPAYKAIVSNAIFNDYFSPARNYKVYSVKRVLRNIRGGAKFSCKKIHLLDVG